MVETTVLSYLQDPTLCWIPHESFQIRIQISSVQNRFPSSSVLEDSCLGQKNEMEDSV